MARLGIDGRVRGLAVGRLSTGQRRRAALAAVVAREPELWLLDEPHAGFDAGGRELLDVLVREAAASGATVILASHELDRAAPLATRHVLMAGGRVTGGALRATGGPTGGTGTAGTTTGDRREAAGVVA
jgi:energy-coupling factor transporter ATP-binding protein EcfA2